MSKGIMSSRGLEGLQGTQMLPKFQNMPQMAFGNNPMFMPQKPMSLFGNYRGIPMQPPMQQPMQPPMQPPIQRPIDIPGKQPSDIFIEQQPMVPKPQSLLNPPQLSQMQKPQNPMSIGRLPINLFR